MFLLPNEFVARRPSRFLGGLRVHRLYGRVGRFDRPSATFHPLPQLRHGLAL